MQKEQESRLKTVKLTNKAIEAIKAFQSEFGLKNQSDSVVLGLGWGKQFFSVEKQVRDDLVSQVKQHEMLIGALVKRLTSMDNAVTKLWLQVQVLMKLHPEAQGELEKLIASVQKAKAELHGAVTMQEPNKKN